MSGLLGKIDLQPAETGTNIYTVPSGKVATVNISACNRTDATGKFTLCCITGTRTDADYLEHETSVPAHGVLERSGIVMSAGESVRVYTDQGVFSVRVHGFEENL